MFFREAGPKPRPVGRTWTSLICCSWLTSLHHIFFFTLADVHWPVSVSEPPPQVPHWSHTAHTQLVCKHSSSPINQSSSKIEIPQLELYFQTNETHLLRESRSESLLPQLLGCGIRVCSQAFTTGRLCGWWAHNKRFICTNRPSSWLRGSRSVWAETWSANRKLSVWHRRTLLMCQLSGVMHNSYIPASPPASQMEQGLGLDLESDVSRSQKMV